MQSIQKLGKIEAAALDIAIISNNIIFNMPSIIYNNSGSSAWINIIYLNVISLIFILITVKLWNRFPGLDILDISQFAGGNLFKTIIGMLYIFFFMSFSAICIRYIASNLHLIYFSNMPILFLIILCFIPIIIASKIGLKAIYGTNLIVIPITILSIILLLSVSAQDFSIQKLFPIFGYGAENTFLTNLKNIFAFNVIGYLYFLPPFLKNSTDFKKIAIFAVILCGLYFLLAIISLTMSIAFTYNADETLSVYLLSRSINLGRFFERIDALFIFVWILVFFSFLSLNVYLICFITKKCFNISNSNELTYSISLILIGFALVFKNIASVTSFTKNIFTSLTIGLIFILGFLTLLFSYIKSKKRKAF